MAACGINSSEISFLDKNIPPSLQVMRWLKFCKTVYIHKCNLYSMKPPLSNISYMMSQSTHEDCFNTRTLTAYCISIILSAFIIVANTVILTAFVRDRSKLLRSSNLPIISLAMSDLLTGITFLYSSTWNLVILTAGYEFDIFKTLHYVRLKDKQISYAWHWMDLDLCSHAWCLLCSAWALLHQTDTCLYSILTNIQRG